MTASKYQQKQARKYKATESSKTAQFANKRARGPTKAEKWLAIRIKDWERTLAASKNDLSRSYHKPGSLQR